MSEELSPEAAFDIPELRQLSGLATATQVASILKCSRRHVLNECSAGRLVAMRIAGKFLVTPHNLKNYIQERIISCQKETVEPISNGLMPAKAGTYFGTKVDVNARNQRALEIASKLSKSSASTSRKKTNPLTS